MRRLALFTVAALLAVILALAYSAGTNAETRECVRRAPKGGRVCLQWAVTAASTTTTVAATTTTEAPTTTVPAASACDLGSAERQQAWSDTIRFYIYADNQATVAFDAYVFTVACPGSPMAVTGQAVIDCFNGGTSPACIQTPENPAGVFEGIVYFAQALVPPANPD